MLTPPSRVLALSPHARLDALLAVYPRRWAAHTVAGARALPLEETGTLAPSEWAALLDVLDAALAPIAAMISPESVARIRYL